MEYTDDFKERVLAVVEQPDIKEDILNGKMDLGDYLQKYAFKGIDPTTILECLDVYELDYLAYLARLQQQRKALYEEWWEYYVMKSGSTLEQKAIEEEIKQKKVNRGSNSPLPEKHDTGFNKISQIFDTKPFYVDDD